VSRVGAVVPPELVVVVVVDAAVVPSVVPAAGAPVGVSLHAARIEHRARTFGRYNTAPPS
jgi:hypothetical protein